jgi:phenylalanyl-tRNA synthetase alpha chain
MGLDERVPELRERFRAELASAGSAELCRELRDRWLARETGLISVEMRRLREIPKEERPEFGAAVNALRGEVEAAIAAAAERFRDAERAAALARARVDVTRPGFPFEVGAEHPIKRLQSEIEAILVSMGFRVFDVPEIETDHYNFEALNLPAYHPARDAQDTFYLPGARLLRTHCSTVQAHALEQVRPPVRAVATGKVYRRDPFDATHSPMFYQADVLAVDEGITMADLKGTLDVFLKQIFHPDTRLRLRPGFFPFVEPGAEVDISCIFCFGKGCRKCKGSGWIEILGAGIVHPKVLRMAGVDESRYSGFAWGMGIDRVAILKYGVEDIRLLFENDLRFLKQF